MQQLVHGERVARAVRLQRAAADKAAAEARSERLAAGGAASQGAPLHLYLEGDALTCLSSQPTRWRCACNGEFREWQLPNLVSELSGSRGSKAAVQPCTSLLWHQLPQAVGRSTGAGNVSRYDWGLSQQGRVNRARGRQEAKTSRSLE